jgi:phosphate transport system substrate-binding protein
MHPAVRAGAAALAAASLAAPVGAQARDQIRVVGSSTVFPYSQAVAEEFANKTGHGSPVIESTGTGGGIRLFCSGIGTDGPDIVAASRPMTRSEYAECVANGVDDLDEILFGYDGVIIAHAAEAPDMDLTTAQLFEALAAEVEVDGRIAENPYARWSQIDPLLPDRPIEVFGPPPTSGTRDAFVEQVMRTGCAAFPAIRALEPGAREAVCSRMRRDGRFVEAGENDNLIVQRLEADATAIGIFGYPFLYQNSDRLKAVPIGGVLPTPDAIATRAYPASRPLLLYVKNAHRGVIPGLDAFVTEYVSEESLGPDGYLSARGLIPLAADARANLRAAVANGRGTGRFD